MYRVTGHYSREHDAGVFWNDPQLDLPWPISPDVAILSEKDLNLPLLADCDTLFDYSEFR